ASLTPATAGWDPTLDQNTGEPKPAGPVVHPTPNGQAAGPQTPSRCRVIASSNDHDNERHIAVAIQTMDYCKRAVMAGRHIVVLLDSLTRVGRAFNRSRRHSSSGRTMTGGI